MTERTISTDSKSSRRSSGEASDQDVTWRLGTRRACPGETGNPSQRPRMYRPAWNTRAASTLQKGQAGWVIVALCGQLAGCGLRGVLRVPHRGMSHNATL